MASLATSMMSEHHDKVLPPLLWAELLEICIIDLDGWRAQAGPTRKYWFKRDFEAPIPLEEFIIRVSNSTIVPTMPIRHSCPGSL